MQHGKLNNRDWLNANSDAHSFPDKGSIIGEVLRVRVTATVTEEVKITEEWIGRLTGNAQSPTMTYKWGLVYDQCGK